MDFKYIKPLENKSLVNEFEDVCSHKFSESFAKFVLEKNGSRPSCSVFYTKQNKERVMKSFLSFNKQDRETIWSIWDICKSDLKQKLIPFAIDNFGNLICFNEKNNVVFWEHETIDIDFIANDFDEFLNNLKQ